MRNPYLRDFWADARCYQKRATTRQAAPACVVWLVITGLMRRSLISKTSHSCGTRRPLAAGMALFAAVSIAAPAMAPEWLKAGDFGAIIMPARPNAVYLRAKYFHCTGNLEAMLASAQTALALGVSEQGLTMTDIYLRVTCAVACYSLGRTEEARQWLTEAMQICLPHGFIAPFAEVVTSMGGLVEQTLEQSFPAAAPLLSSGERGRTGPPSTTSLQQYHLMLSCGAISPSWRPGASIRADCEQYNISIALKNIMRYLWKPSYPQDELAKYVY